MLLLTHVVVRYLESLVGREGRIPTQRDSYASEIGLANLWILSFEFGFGAPPVSLAAMDQVDGIDPNDWDSCGLIGKQTNGMAQWTQRTTVTWEENGDPVEVIHLQWPFVRWQYLQPQF